MTVRRMSALPWHFYPKFSLSSTKTTLKNGTQHLVRISPKAEVRGSNPFGRATPLGRVTNFRLSGICGLRRFPVNCAARLTGASSIVLRT
jgi:hypothetical protein